MATPLPPATANTSSPKPNNQASPGTIGNVPGLITPQPDPYPANQPIAPIKLETPEEGLWDSFKKGLKNGAQYYKDNVSGPMHDLAGSAMDKGGNVAMGGVAATAVGGGMVLTGVGAAPGAVIATGGAVATAAGGVVSAGGAVTESAATVFDSAADAIISGKAPNVIAPAIALGERLLEKLIARKIPGLGKRGDNKQSTAQKTDPAKKDDGGHVKDKPKDSKGDKPSDCCPKDTAAGKKGGVPIPGKTRHPVHLGTGEEILHQTDFVLDGPQPFAWTRSYRSGSEAEDWGILGARWATPYTASLSVCKRGIVYHEDSGRALRLPALAVGQPHDHKSEGFVLWRDNANQFTLTWRDGSTDTFTRAPDGWLPHGYDGVNAMLVPGEVVATERYYLTRSTASDGRYTTVERLHNAQPGEVLLRIRTVDGQVIEAIRDAQAPEQAARSGDVPLAPIPPRIGRVEEVRPDGSRICHVSYTYAPDPGAPDTPTPDTFATLPRRYNLVTQTNVLGEQRSYAYQHHLLVRYTTYSGFAHGLEWVSLDRLRERWARSPLSDAQLTERHPITLANSYQARATRTTTADGNAEVQIEYIRYDTTRVTEADGDVLEFTFDNQWLCTEVHRIPAEGPPQSLGRRLWSRDGHLMADIDAQGKATRYTYDSAGNLTSITDAKGRSTHVAYNSQNLPTCITDALGHTTQRRFDAAGRIIESVDALGHITRYQYDAAGRLSTLVDALGGAKQLNYDGAGRLVAYTDCSNLTERYAYDEHGRVCQTTNALGLSTQYQYDALGRLVHARHPDNTTERYAYDSEDNLLTHADGKGQITRYRYNGHGLPVERTDAKGQSLHYHYDRALRLVKLVNANGETYSFAYDAASRLISETGFDGKTTTYTYDSADQLTASECNGQRTDYRRDALGLLQAKTTAQGITRYAYDALDRLTAVASPDARQHFIYDSVGQLIAERMAYALGGGTGEENHPVSTYTGFTLTHSYDALGNRVQTTLPNGRTIDTLRYGSGHWHGSLWQGSPLVDIERDYLHRETSRQLSGVRRSGTSAQLQTAPLVTTRSYDPQSRLTAIMLHKGAQRLRRRSYQYDASGNLTDIQDSQRGATQYRYDPVGQLLSAVQPHLSETFAFDPAGNLLDGANHIADDAPAFGGLARWDNTDRIERLAEQPRPGTSPPKLPKVIHNLLLQYLDHSYEYDIQGNTVIKRLNAGLTSPNQAAELAFTYDADNRLVQATRTWAMPGGKAELTARYRYDAFGRRIAKQVTEGGQTSTTLFVWDGDVLMQEINADSTITYLYEPDSFVPLARIESDGGIDSYHYAAQAMYLPYEAQWDLPHRWHIHDAHVGAYWAHQEQIKERQHQQAWQQRLHLANQAAANDRIYHYQCDHLGTPLELMDGGGNVVWAARYKAWGRVLRYDKRDVEQPLRFQGQYEDAETGLFYNRHRYYDPDQARYITQDPIGLLGGLNLYAYAPNATAWVDPFGLTAKCQKKKGPSGRFSTPDAAAKAALVRYNGKSIRDNLEYGGLIYQTPDGRYDFTKATRGSTAGVDPWDPKATKIPLCAKEAGYWHTHGDYSDKYGNRTRNSKDYFDSNNFSPEDMNAARIGAQTFPGYRGYVGTPSGAFKGFNGTTGITYKL